MKAGTTPINAPSPGLAAKASSEVNSAEPNAIHVSTVRGPKRSAIRPPGS